MEGLDEKRKIAVVCGPTATGKTDLAFALCKTFCGELVGADSMQVYQGLAVGTAAPRDTESPDIPRHLFGYLPPQQPFSVAEYLVAAEKTIGEILRRKRLPVVCGGTGLYVDSLVNGVHFTEGKVDDAIVESLASDWEREGAQAMLERLRKRDPDHADKLHVNDKKRILRALAESEANGTTLAQRNEISQRRPPGHKAFVLGLGFKDRGVLYGRIEERIDRMLKEGLLEEAYQVYCHRDQYRTAAQAIGYKEYFPYFDGKASSETCTIKLKQATRNYAKRQLTWFRAKPYVHWLYVDEGHVLEKGEEMLRTFLSERQ